MISKLILLGTNKPNKIVFGDLIRAIDLLTKHVWDVPRLDEIIARGIPIQKLVLAVPRQFIGCEIPIMTRHGILTCVPHDIRVENGCLLMEVVEEGGCNEPN